MSRFRTVWGKQGPPGTGLTSGEKTTINSRLTALEGDIGAIPDSIGDMTDVDLAGIAANDLLRWDGTKLVKHTPTTVIPFSLPLVMGDGTGTIAAASVPARGIYIPDDCTITGYVMDADNAITVRVERALAASPTTYATISGSAHPTLSGAGTTGKVTTLTGWTTSIGEGDRLRLLVTGAPVAWSATLNLLLTREV